MTKTDSMPKTLPQKAPDAPLYVRWIPDSCPYALEMRLGLITLLRSELQTAELRGTEFGGAFIGVFPTTDSPTLRLDDLVLVPGDPAFGREYGLASDQLNRLAEITAQARFTERPVVGFFRSHMRDTSAEPEETDVAMLSRQFPEGLYAFLIIDAKGPRGEFFLAVSGDLPEIPSTPPFLIDESEFGALPEVPPETTEDVRNFGIGRKTVRPPLPWAAVASLAILVFLVGLWVFGSSIAQMFRPASNQVDLTVMSYGTNLKISWDHSSPVISKALGATIVILDGNAHREVRLDSDDLRLGQIGYARLTRKVYVVMRLDSPGLKLPPQTFDWTGD